MTLTDSIAQKLAGKFIVLDGPDGAGKSTHRERLERDLISHGVDVISCRDPGGTEIGNRIRAVLLNYDLSEMNRNCEALLFMASRAQLVGEIIRPGLAEGKTVLCDRFVTSTCAYQGAAGYDPKRVIELAKFAIDDCWPDATVIIDVDTEKGFDRIGRKPHHAGKNRKAEGHQTDLFADTAPDAMEARPIDFHRRTRQIFLEVHKYYPTPVITVDGNAEADVVYGRVVEELSRVLG